MSGSDEIPLEGGNTNTVFRVGNTVRRTQSPHSVTHHRLLAHLANNGFNAAPMVLGIDEKGREILTFIEGETLFPPDLWTNAAPLIAAAEMLAAFHAATQDFALQDATWAISDPDPTQHEVICHNDFAPYNMVFRDGLPAAIIDFDLCGPGPRLRDLAYLAYWMVPLSFAAEDLVPLTQAQVAQGFPRLHTLCRAYGTTDTADLLTKVADILHHMASFDSMQTLFGTATAQKLQTEGHLAHWAREAAAYDTVLPDLLKQFS